MSGERSQQVLETQQSYETEWDMVNTVSFKKRPCSNTECEFSALFSYSSVTEIFNITNQILHYRSKTWNTDNGLMFQQNQMHPILQQFSFIFIGILFGSFLMYFILRC